jgi:branched-chain amino acid transport system substrate-binding protein
MKPRLVALLAATAVLALGCGNSGGSSSGGGNASGGGGGPAGTVSAADLQKNVPSTQAGVTDTEIRVTSIGAITNVLGVDYSQAPNGTQAYFDMINSRGGIYGRKLVLVERKDDQMTNNSRVAQEITTQNDVFAVLPVTTPLFLGAQELADAGIPTFGWAINREWAGQPALFGEKGSVVDVDNGTLAAPFLADKLGARKVALLAYGVDQSKDCAAGMQKAFEKSGSPAQIAFTDDTIPFGATDYTVQVQKMKDAGVDFAFMCIDSNGAVALGKELVKQQVKIPLMLSNAYEPDVAEKYGDVLDGAYVLTAFPTLETNPAPTGIQEFKEWTSKVPGAKLGEQSITGWMNADLFYRALAAAGPEFTRASVIASANQITDWNADGLAPHIDWTKAHDQTPNPYCFTVSLIKDKAFVPQFAEPGKPFVCIDINQTPIQATNAA